jgi:hypothetical protein
MIDPNEIIDNAHPANKNFVALIFKLSIELCDNPGIKKNPLNNNPSNTPSKIYTILVVFLNL